jgi:DNA modification methylase
VNDTQLNWKTEKRTVESLIPYQHNPRRLTTEQEEHLRESLERFNLVEIPAVNTNGIIIAGHQRLAIMKALGRGSEEIDVRVPSRELTELELKEYNLRSNKNTGEWDYLLLGNNFDLEMLKDVGFNSAELDKIFKPEYGTKDDEVPEVQATTIKQGDLFKLGDHRLLCGDCTNKDHVARLMAGQKAEMVFTDPPYNVDYQGGMNSHGQNKRNGIKNDCMGQKEYYSFLTAFIEQCMAVCNGVFYICIGNSQMHTLRNAFEDKGGHWQNFIIWVKNAFTLSRSDYQHQYEVILYGWNKKVTNHYFIEDRSIPTVWEDLRNVKSKFDGEYTSIKFQGFEVKIKGKAEGVVSKKKQKTDIWRYDKPTKSAEHPTMKPVMMVCEAIENSSHRDGIVLDVFGGSGTTIVACEKLDRKCRTMELDPLYCDVIIRRWQDITGIPAEPINA